MKQDDRFKHLMVVDCCWLLPICRGASTVQKYILVYTSYLPIQRTPRTADPHDSDVLERNLIGTEPKIPIAEPLSARWSHRDVSSSHTHPFIMV